MSSPKIKRHSKASPHTPCQPIFLVGHCHTGSTLLRYILDTHAEIYCPPQAPWVSHIENSIKINEHLFAGHPLYSDPGRLGERIIEDAKQRFRAIMDAATAKSGKRLWCLTHDDSIDLPKLKKVYPEAKYICLHRHCMDLIHSVREILQFNWRLHGFYHHISARDPSRVVDSLADYWCEQAKASYDFEQENKSQCFQIKYESMALQTQTTCRELFSFLGVNYNENLIGNIFLREHQRSPADFKISGTRKIESRSIGRGRKIPVDKIKPAILEKMNALLKKLDYETVGADWCSKPASMYAVGDELAQRFAADKLKEIFEHTIPNRLESILSSKNPATCEVRIKDIENAAWFIDFAASECVRSNGKQIPDCKVFVNFETLVELFRKEVDPLSALDHGTVYIEGNRLVFRDFEKLLEL